LSDQVAAIVQARQVKGASIGFIPVRYTLSKDPTRPFGVDFLEIRVIEWSICSIPCCPAALAIGPAGNKSASAASAVPSTTREQRMAEARALAAKVRSTIADVPSTRERRIAEARAIRRAVYRV
jgi:phage head maturation protease